MENQNVSGFVIILANNIRLHNKFIRLEKKQTGVFVIYLDHKYFKLEGQHLMMKCLLSFTLFS